MIVAAVLIFALLLGINYLGGLMDGTTVAWANIVQRVLESKAFVCHVTATTEGTITSVDQTIDTLVIEMKSIFSEEYGTKIEMVTTANEKNAMLLTYMIPAQNRIVTVMPDLKQYMTVEFSNDLAKNIQKNWEKNDPRKML
jgi:hypothetical protein